METRTVYRNSERMLLKITSVASHISLNETCVNNGILPIYTNIYIYIYIYIYILTFLLYRLPVRAGMPLKDTYSWVREVRG